MSELVSQKLFFCREEGCIKSYQWYSSLQEHLEIGKHKRALERETLFDRAMLGYASRLEHRASAVPEIHDSEVSPSSSSGPSLPMGSALQSSSARRTRFSTKQKDYLIGKFKIGEQTGQKVDSAMVSRGMRTAKDKNGKPLFNSNKFRTSRQVARFF